MFDSRRLQKSSYTSPTHPFFAVFFFTTFLNGLHAVGEKRSRLVDAGRGVFDFVDLALRVRFQRLLTFRLETTTGGTRCQSLVTL